MDESRVAVVIEDDEDIRVAVSTLLRESGFTVYVAGSGVEGVAAVRQFHPDVMTLDIGLPDIDGFEVARRVRQFSDSYIIMITARQEEPDILLGLESGADDYLTKPFRPRELRARVSALMRRQRGHSSQATHPGAVAFPGSRHASTPDLPALGPVLTAQLPAAHPAAPSEGRRGGRLEAVLAVPAPITGGGVLEHNGLIVHVATRTATVSGAEVDLTRTEFELLAALMEAGRVVLTKAELARRLRFRDYDTGGFVSVADERTVEVHIGNLRRKLGDLPKLPRWVETVRGIGYRMTPSQEVLHESSLSR